MIVSVKHKFVFLCMPKCASTSTEAVLRKYGQLLSDNGPHFKHLNLRNYEKFIRPLIHLRARKGGGIRQRMEVLCLFREPVDWVYSLYRYRTRTEIVGNSKSAINVSFEEFAREYVTPNPRPFARGGRQIEFVKNREGAIGDITIFRYENYAGFLKHMSEKVGEEISGVHLNPSPEAESYDVSAFGFLADFLQEEYEVYNKLAKA